MQVKGEGRQYSYSFGSPVVRRLQYNLTERVKGKGKQYSYIFGSPVIGDYNII